MFSLNRKTRGATTGEYSLMICLLLLTGLSLANMIVPFNEVLAFMPQEEEQFEVAAMSASGSEPVQGMPGDFEKNGSLLMQENGGGSITSGTDVALECEGCSSTGPSISTSSTGGTQMEEFSFEFR